MLALMAFKIDLNVILHHRYHSAHRIVKKNAIMMIDFALVAEREEARPRPRPFTRLASSLPAHPHDDDGCYLRRTTPGFGTEQDRAETPLGITIVGD